MKGTSGARASGAAGAFAARALRWLLTLVLSGALLWIVSLYDSGLRDPRYLDGWVLAAGMGLQLVFHIAMTAGSLSPRAAARWKRVHILVGYLLVAAFVSHSDFGLPDTAFEWVLWTCFVLVALSGVLGTYLAWSIRTKGRIDESLSHDRIPSHCANLARAAEAAVARKDSAGRIDLPGLPYDGWIADLYAAHLREFFAGPRNLAGHLVGSERALARLTGEIDTLLPYMDQPRQEKLAAIRSLVVEKDRLDFARAHLALARGWLLVHVPVTYALLLLSVAHILVMYAFSSGAW